MVVLLDESDEERTKKLQQRGSDPFPGLIADSPSAKSAFRFNNSRYIQLSRNRVEDMYSLSLVKDSTLILRDHAVSIDTKELGRYEYTIKLAYLAFYGDEIDPSNVADVLDDLIASSVERWMSAENG